jgi:hypothetical protein
MLARRYWCREWKAKWLLVPSHLDRLQATLSSRRVGRLRVRVAW